MKTTELEIISFLKNLNSDKTEINNLKETFRLKEVSNRLKENIYFLSGIKDGVIGRASDKDIATKKYFAIDIDIANNYKEQYGEELVDDIPTIAKDMINTLNDNDTVFKNWRYVVFSGRGLHFYYTFKKQSFNIQEYSLGVREYYKQGDITREQLNEVYFKHFISNEKKQNKN